MKTVLITGVNRGIGNALAQQFLENNWKVIGTVRDNDSVSNLESFEYFQKELLDVTDFSSMDNLAQQLKGESIDVILNNAGVMDGPSLSDGIYNDEQKLMNVYMVNTIAPYILVEKLLPNLNLGNEKLVVSVSSLLSKMENMLSTHWIYGSSKMALNYVMNAFSQNYPTIKSVLVRPGWVRTDMGGDHAPMNVKDSANIIFNNIQNHKTKLPADTMVGPDGDITHF